MKKTLLNGSIKMEVSEYINKEYNLRLKETRQFCIETDVMLDVDLEVYHLGTNELISTDNSPEWLVDQLCDDVWFFNWEPQESSTEIISA